MSRALGRRTVALAYGIACHGAFVAAIAAMVTALHQGMATGQGRLHGAAAWAADLGLALQFPLLHSFLLSAPGRRTLAALAPAGLGRDLAPTTYALVAALQLLATFVLWSPLGPVWWRPEGLLAALWWLPFAASWLLLVRALGDGGLALQTGFVGWSAVLRGRRPQFGPMPTGGLFAHCRQPIYLGFATTLWTGPVWTPDHLLIAVLWTGYCVLGPLHKERRFARLHGDTFAAYRARVPYMIPRFTR